MKSKIGWIALIAAALIAIAVTILVVATVNKQESIEKTASTEQVKVERTLSGKTAAEDKAAVLATAVALLELTTAPSNEKEFQARMEAVESGTEKMPEEMKKYIRLVDSLATEEGIESTIHQTLLTFATFAKQSTGTDTVAPLYDNAADAIVLDQELGIAYVPTSLFVSSGSGVNGFSMEFLYVDGEWLFSPYMTLDELRLALVLQGATTPAAG